MNNVQLFLLALAAVFLLLLVIRVGWALTYGRYVVLGLAAALVLMPFVWLIAAAFKDPDVMNVYTFFPPIGQWGEDLGLDNFVTLFTPARTVEGELSFWRHIFNSVFLAAAGTVISLFFSSLGGYALAKYQFRFRGLILTFMLASMTIPGVTLLAPSFELIYHLGLLDSFAAILIPGAVSVFGIFLFRQAILQVPNELIEAGRIDGCGEFAIYLKLVMPLVRPMTGAFCLVTFLGMWNSFLGPSILLQSQFNLPLPVILNQYVGLYQQQYGVFLAGTLLAIIPPALLFLFLQREFISGLSTGAVKG